MTWYSGRVSGWFLAFYWTLPASALFWRGAVTDASARWYGGNND